MKRTVLVIAWLLACVGTAISLYDSEVRHLTPCLLCWYQRCALFPLVLILGIAAWQRFAGIALYTLPQTVLGALLAAYQCCAFFWQAPTCPCAWMQAFRIPLFSFLLFLVLTLLLIISLIIHHKSIRNNNKHS